MSQEQAFVNYEANNWFKRNQTLLEEREQQDKFDWLFEIVKLLQEKSTFKRVIELGCANGWRLQRLSKIIDSEFFGIDASTEAIQDGHTRYPSLKLYQGVLSDIPIDGEFDLVIVSGVLCWIDRHTLVKSISEIDRMVKNNGFLAICDFLPNFQHKRNYHHDASGNLYTYKQDYAKIFESFGIYNELIRVNCNHDATQPLIQFSASDSRWCCSLLKKSILGFYQDFTP